MDQTASATAGSADGTHITLPCQFCEKWNRVDASKAAQRPRCGECGKPILLDRPFMLTGATFARVIADSEVPVLVDFYADWCGPCKQMAPAVDEMARRHEGRALIAKLNTDHAPQVSQDFGIRGIPTSIVFRLGKESARQVGAVPLAGLEALLSSVP